MVGRSDPQSHGGAPDLFDAIRAAEDEAGGRHIGGDAMPAEEAVRLRGALRPTATPAEVEQMDSRPGTLVATGFGLAGPGGVLPPHLGEMALQRLRSRDPALAEFIALLDHRAISFFYRAHGKYRPALSAGAAGRLGGDPIARAIDALIGFGEPAVPAMLGAIAHPLRGTGAVLARPARSAAGLRSALAALLGQPVEIRPFRPARLDLARAERSRLGRAFAGLGRNAVLGASVLDVQSSFEVVLGPLDRRAFERMLMEDGPARTVFAFLRIAAGPGRRARLRLRLRREDVPLPRLAADSPPRLGLTSWLKTRTHSADRDDVVLRAPSY